MIKRGFSWLGSLSMSNGGSKSNRGKVQSSFSLFYDILFAVAKERKYICQFLLTCDEGKSLHGWERATPIK